MLSASDTIRFLLSTTRSSRASGPPPNGGKAGLVPGKLLYCTAFSAGMTILESSLFPHSPQAAT